MRRSWALALLLALVPVAVLATALSQPGFAQYTPEASLERGHELYMGTCASCHGQRGEGAGMLGLGIPRIDAQGAAWQSSDIDLTLLIRNGKGAMPGVGGTWSKEDVAAVLRLMKSWWTPEQLEARGEAPQTGAP